MNKLISCHYNMDTNRVEARFEDETTLAIAWLRPRQAGRLIYAGLIQETDQLLVPAGTGRFTLYAETPLRVLHFFGAKQKEYSSLRF